MDAIGEHFMDHAVELVKQGHKFVFVLDNIDWTVKAHAMRSDNQNQNMHAVATSLVFECVPQTDLTSADKPQQSLSKIDVMKLVTETDNDRACTKERYKGIIAL